MGRSERKEKMGTTANRCHQWETQESVSSVGVGKTNGSQIGFWAMNFMDVMALKGKGGQDILKTRDFQT